MNGDGAAVEFKLKDKIKELVELAKEQGYLSHDDVEESQPGKKPDQKQLDQVYTELRKHEVRIVDQADVDSVLPGGREERDVAKEKEKDKLDILDDPVRMYLKQMGQVPLLTREQEVEISKRIENAENEVKRI
ncbi:MAG: sigma-70 factor domain-containing protein, partial [Verrucomicrobiota bacterium]|nr:sigma-70 factor domain-containing protein [Verrucomicrobiota bacterium]